MTLQMESTLSFDSICNELVDQTGMEKAPAACQYFWVIAFPSQVPCRVKVPGCESLFQALQHIRKSCSCVVPELAHMNGTALQMSSSYRLIQEKACPLQNFLLINTSLRRWLAALDAL